MTARFDPLGPLPSATTLLEASAGTGKTYTIAALATRYIAEGVTTIDQMLMITFGRNATRELRERVRAALTQARDALRTGATSEDAVVRHLLGLPADERDAAADRLSRAVADFDAGTIATTHQFCQNTLKGLGISADIDPGEVFVDSISELVDEVVDDFYVRKYGGSAIPGEHLTYEDARQLAGIAVNTPQAALDAGPVDEGSIHHTRVAFAHAVRAEVLRRRRQRRLVTFDDLSLRLRDALTDPRTGEHACRRLRQGHQIVLVDEFQDTDPAQWTILRTAFHGHRTLILIGDPKQAIYAFRGADVFSYLDAKEHADHHATLPTNWRSDRAVVQGIETIMGGIQLGDPRISVFEVDAAHERSRLQGPPSEARVRLRTLPVEQKLPGVGVQRKAVAADVAADIVATLDGPGRLTSHSDSRPIEPGDIAVLTGTNKQAALIRDALLKAGVPAVVASSTSVFSTPAASQWSVLLRAMQRPRGSAVRAAAIGDFFGYTAEDLALRGEQVDADVALTMRIWAQILEDGSVAEMVATMQSQTQYTVRVLSRPSGERHLTDLRHVAGALHAQQRATRMGLVGLRDWLDRQIRRAAESDREPTAELTRRLESDAQAVQVRTIHTSKGLEFPIVYVPYGWDYFPPDPKHTLRCHDASGRAVLDVRGPGAIDRERLIAARDAEQAGESLRLLYVALTRASSQLVVHWAPSARNTACAPLHRVLAARTAGVSDPDLSYAVTTPALTSPWVAVESVEPARRARWSPPEETLPELGIAAFTRRVDTSWRRTSYSGLTASVHEAERRPSGFRDDEPDEVVADLAPVGDAEGLLSPFADMPAGAAFGTLVHGVLESVDTDRDDLADELLARSRERLGVFPVAEISAQDLSDALLPALRTPLGEIAGNVTLAQIPTRDRLAELDFELPMGQMSTATLSDLARLLRRHLPAGDPLIEYPERLDSPGLAESTLVGYLSGSIDAVLRVDSSRFLVVDYKTNLLRDPAAPGTERLVDGYHRQALATAMMDAHYPLQALLYAAALHRYLRWRLPGYDPRVNFGGVLYLFLRGMAGPQTPPGHGVFDWQPPPALIVALSDLLDGRP